MASRRIARATQPHLPTLTATLAPLLSAANAGAFQLRYEARLTGSEVVIEQASFTNVDTALVDAAVASAPAYSDALDVKAQINALPLLQKAILLTIIDAINVERARHSVAAITPTQAIANIVAKVDTL